ncbi:MAG: peptidoglycan/xylan/chitin deacetylase (PgdA/CDA1 family) [Pseudohongiellaceae bacterium]
MLQVAALAFQILNTKRSYKNIWQPYSASTGGEKTVTYNVIKITFLSLFFYSMTFSEKYLNDPFNAVVLTYHHVANDTPAITSISPQNFEQQLQYIESKQFNVWPLPKIISALQQRQAIPPKVIAITFDDAYLSIFEHAYPLLKKRNYPFTIFVTTDSVDNQYNHQLSWPKLLEMSKNGATIANHTVNHPHMLKRLDDETTAQWQQRMRDEIIQAQQRIDEEITSQDKPQLFAYPYGEHNDALKKLVKDLGYVAFGQQSGAIGSMINRQILPRFPISGNYTDLTDFSLKINTLALPAKEIAASDNPITADNAKPMVKLAFTREINRHLFKCYGPGGALNIDWQGNIATIHAADPIPAGRSRYNCTLPTTDDRFYWYSKAWVRLKDNGDWVLD